MLSKRLLTGKLSSQQVWRWAGGVALTGAVFMLILGQTALKEQLSPVEFVLYWSACVSLTLFAMLAALLDLRRIRRTGRDQQKILFENTIASIREETSKQKPKPKPGLNNNHHH